jgi:hypothetical protein
VIDFDGRGNQPATAHTRQLNVAARGPAQGRARLSETAGSSATIAPIGPMLLLLATVLGLRGYSYILGPGVSERHALLPRSPDTAKIVRPFSLGRPLKLMGMC